VDKNKKVSKPNAANVAAVLIRQGTPSMWTDEEWEAHVKAYDQDMAEFREAVKREQKEHPEQGQD
jgi:hypothetical protein